MYLLPANIVCVTWKPQISIWRWRLHVRFFFVRAKDITRTANNVLRFWFYCDMQIKNFLPLFITLVRLAEWLNAIVFHICHVRGYNKETTIIHNQKKAMNEFKPGVRRTMCRCFVFIQYSNVIIFTENWFVAETKPCRYIAKMVVYRPCVAYNCTMTVSILSLVVIMFITKQ